MACYPATISRTLFQLCSNSVLFLCRASTRLSHLLLIIFTSNMGSTILFALFDPAELVFVLWPRHLCSARSACLAETKAATSQTSAHTSCQTTHGDRVGPAASRYLSITVLSNSFRLEHGDFAVSRQAERQLSAPSGRLPSALLLSADISSINGAFERCGRAQNNVHNITRAPVAGIVRTAMYKGRKALFLRSRSRIR
jgi:hypothetical protein